MYDVVGLFAVAAAAAGIAHYRPAGWKPWLLIAGGQLAFIVGDILWTVFLVRGEDPYPSIADAA